MYYLLPFRNKNTSSLRLKTAILKCSLIQSRYFSVLGNKTKTHLTVAHSQRPPIGSNKNVVFNLSSIQKTAFFTMIFLFPWTSAEAAPDGSQAFPVRHSHLVLAHNLKQTLCLGLSYNTPEPEVVLSKRFFFCPVFYITFLLCFLINHQRTEAMQAAGQRPVSADDSFLMLQLKKGGKTLLVAKTASASTQNHG